MPVRVAAWASRSGEATEAGGAGGGAAPAAAPAVSSRARYGSLSWRRRWPHWRGRASANQQSIEYCVPAVHPRGIASSAPTSAPAISPPPPTTLKCVATPRHGHRGGGTEGDVAGRTSGGPVARVDARPRRLLPLLPMHRAFPKYISSYSSVRLLFSWKGSHHRYSRPSRSVLGPRGRRRGAPRTCAPGLRL